MQVYQRRYSLIVFVILMLAAMIVSPTLAQQRDSDGDGVPDSRDKCPNQPGPAANDGCPYIVIIPPPPADTDGDGLPDSDDQCPTVAGPRENRGCPQSNPNPDPDPNPPASDLPLANPQVPDNDNDGIPNDRDECPDVPGFLDWNGCPPPPPPFEPPLLSNDACFVTASGDFNARVRVHPTTESEHIGNLLPGVIYPAVGIVNTSEGAWVKLAKEFEHLDFEAWNGTDGYVSDDVVNHSNCPTLEVELIDDLIAPQPELCFLNVGFDSPTWSNDPQVPSYTYVALWFAAAPGEAIPVGTPAWGVIYLAPYITLPDSVNIFAIATDPAIMQAAIDSGYGGTYNWPTQAGGIQSGDTTLYRLTGSNGGNCGPIGSGIVNPDLPLASPSTNDPVVFVPPIDQFACTITTPFNWVFAFNAAPGEAIPVGTSAQAVISGDLENFGDASKWVAELRTLGDEQVEYMTYGQLGDGDYRSFPRTGGTCGAIGDGGTIDYFVYPVPAADGDGDVDGRDFLVWQRNYGNAAPYVLGLVFNDDGTPPSETVEICYWQEVGEAGHYQEICIEIEVPDGCVLRNPEAGVYILDCEEDDVELNPILEGLLMGDLQAANNPTHFPEIEIHLTTSYIPDWEGVPPPAETVEICYWDEVGEAGHYQEICIEIEVPDGCVLRNPEAGVYILDCEEDDFVINPDLEGMLMGDLQTASNTVPYLKYELKNVMISSYQTGASAATGGDVEAIPEGPETVEICYWQEVGEAGHYEEVCFEVEIPDGCILRNPEAGVYIIDCDFEVNPALGEMPSDIQSSTLPEPLPFPDGSSPQIPDVPDGCILRNPEAGVYIIDCDFELNPALGEMPSDIQSSTLPEPIPTHGSAVSQIPQFCNGNYALWWFYDENGELKLEARCIYPIIAIQ